MSRSRSRGASAPPARVFGVWLAHARRPGPGARPAGRRAAAARREAARSRSPTRTARRSPRASLRGQAGRVRVHLLDLPDTCPAQVQTIRGALDDLGARRAGRSASPSTRPTTRRKLRAGVPAQAEDDRADGLPARHAARSSRRSGRRSGSRRRPRAATTPPTRCSPTRTGRQRIGFPFDQLTQSGLAHDLARLAAVTAASTSWRSAASGAATSARPWPRSSATARPGSARTHIVAPPGLGQDAARRRADPPGRQARARARAQPARSSSSGRARCAQFTPRRDARGIAGAGRREADRLPDLPGAVPARGPRDRCSGGSRSRPLGGPSARRRPA